MKSVFIDSKFNLNDKSKSNHIQIYIKHMWHHQLKDSQIQKTKYDEQVFSSSLSVCSLH